MEKFPINAGNGSRLASLIDHRLRGNKQLFLVSIDAEDEVSTVEREESRRQLLSLLEEMRRNVAATGVSEEDLNRAIDDAISEVRTHRK